MLVRTVTGNSTWHCRSCPAECVIATEQQALRTASEHLDLYPNHVIELSSHHTGICTWQPDHERETK